VADKAKAAAVGGETAKPPSESRPDVSPAIDSTTAEFLLGGILHSLKGLRREDLEKLADHMLKESSRTLEKSVGQHTDTELRSFLSAIARDLLEQRPAALREVEHRIRAIQISFLESSRV
jgi:hypothetical protein